jgi:alkylation response protein AidB-like acyl-CoA dehydrogenase
VDFGLTKQQEMLRNMVREFAEAELAPRAAELDERAEFPLEQVRRTAELGLVGIVTSPEYGGSGMGHLARMIAIEEVSRVYPPLGFFLQVDPIGIYILETAGTEEQKKKYLPALCRAEKFIATAVTEPTGGSDPTAIQSTARPDGDGWVLNGRKVFITIGEVADLVVMVARTDDKFNAFLVEKGTPGYEATRREKHAGLRSIPVNELAFTDCRIPKENLLGQEGRGLAAALSGITAVGRTGVTGVALGVAQGCYEAALKFARERKLYGKPIADLQAIQFMLVDMNVGIEAGRLLAYKAAWLLDQGKSPRDAGVDIARAKLYTVYLANDVAAKAVEVLGACGTTPEYHVIRRLRDGLELLAAAGTQQVMKVIIGGSIVR